LGGAIVRSLGRFAVLPLHAHIDIRDPATDEYPQWVTGEEAVVATSQCIAVATRGDVDGRVVVELALDDGATIDPGWRQVFEGELLLTGDDVVVGNYVAGEAHVVRVGRGNHRVRVLTRPLDGAGR